jgi:phosphatidylglycerophosphate synthase
VTDAMLRRPKELLLAPIARRTPVLVHPTAITLVAVLPGLGAAFAAADGRHVLALGLWILNRLLDGLDGTVARQRERQSDLGAYLDILMDFVVYAAVPIGLASWVGTRTAWVAATVLLASFYINTISWAYLAAILERRAGAERAPTYTAVAMPGGLVEGTETILFFCAMLLATPGLVPTLFWVMSACVLVTVAQRIVWALTHL